MTSEKPRSVGSVDATLQRTIQSVHKTRWVAIGAVITALAAAVATLGYLYFSQQSELHSSCDWWRAISGATITPAAGQVRPSELGVAIVVYARSSYEGQGCGSLPALSHQLQEWAVYYRLPLN